MQILFFTSIYFVPRDILETQNIFSRDVLKGESENTKIAWPKRPNNEQPTMPEVGLRKTRVFLLHAWQYENVASENAVDNADIC